MNTQKCYTYAYFIGVCTCESDICDYFPVYNKIDLCTARAKMARMYGDGEITECTGGEI